MTNEKNKQLQKFLTKLKTKDLNQLLNEDKKLLSMPQAVAVSFRECLENAYPAAVRAVHNPAVEDTENKGYVTWSCKTKTILDFIFKPKYKVVLIYCPSSNLFFGNYDIFEAFPSWGY